MKKLGIKNKKHTALALVALILVLMMTVGVTYSWIDDVKQVEISTANNADGVPLKTGVDINSDITITNSNNTINLGKIFKDEDIKYYEVNPTNPSETTAHNKYEHNPTDPSRDPDWNTINNKKGYFYESGDMHLSPCYSDGENFFFPKGGSGYREGNKDDENVNYISFTAKVSSPDASVDFWFEDLPAIYKHNTENVIDKARFAIEVDGKSYVYAASNTANTVHTVNNGALADISSSVRKTSVYTFDDPDNTISGRGKNANTLFSIKQGATVLLNIKIWIEDGSDQTIDTSDIRLNLLSSWGAGTRRIKIVDKTTSNGASSWVNNDHAKLYLTCPKVMEELAKKIYNNPTVSKWADIPGTSGYGYAPFYSFGETPAGVTSDGSKYYYADIPMIYNNEELNFYRCNTSGWNDSGSDANERGPYKVHCWNWWGTTLPDTYRNEVYTIYGSSRDDTIYDDFNDDNEFKADPNYISDRNKQSNKGYGTWADVVQIKVKPNANKDHSDYNWAYVNTTKDTDGYLSQKLYLKDFTDIASSKEVYIYNMYYDTSDGYWKAYAPVSSTLIEFYYKGNKKRWWGYKSWGGANPQVRPSGSDTYYFTDVNDSNNDSDGYGYWHGANNVYLIASGTMAGFVNNDNKTPYANMYNGCGTSPTRTTMTLTSDTYTYGDNDYKVFVSNSSQKAGDCKNIKFDNGTQSNTNETGEKTIFPGCYFDWGADTWRGSLTDTSRVASDDTIGDQEETTTPQQSGEVTAITTGEPTEFGIYAYGNLDGGNNYEQYAKFSKKTSGGYIILNLTTGKTYQFFLRQGAKNQSWDKYGQNQNRTLSSSTNGDYIYMNTSDDNKLKVTVSNAGKYKILLNTVGNGSINIKFYYISS